VLQGVLIDEAIEVLFQLTGDFGRSTRARAVDEALRALVGKAMDPLAQRGIGKGQRVGDGLEALAFDDVAHGLGTTEYPGFLGPFENGLSGRESLSGKVEFEGPHRGGGSSPLNRGEVRLQ